MWWWHELYPAKHFLYVVGAFSLAVSILFESIAHVSGAWYSVGEGAFRLFGLFPLEPVFLSFTQFLYVVFLHEFFVDDKRMHYIRITKQRVRLLFFIAALACVGLAQAILLKTVVLPYAFTWVLVGLVLVTIGAAVLSHKDPRASIEKSLHTTLLVAPIFLMFEVIALLNVFVVFANEASYIFSLTVFGELLPLEKLIQILLGPILIIIIYELYFDDAT